MKVLFLLTQLESGGAQTRVVQTVQEAKKLNVDADLAFLYQKRDCFTDVEKIILGKGGSTVSRLATGVVNLARLMFTRKYDVIITNTAPANIIGNTLGKLFGVKTRIAYQTQPPQRLARVYRTLDLVAGSIGLYTRNIVNSEWTRSCFSQYPAAYLKRTELLYDGVNLPRTSLSQGECRKALGIPQSTYMALNIGRLSKQKDQQTIIRAMASVNGKLFIIGEGELRVQLEKLAASMSPGKVEFVGEVNREMLAMYLRAADVFCFSSLWETFGLALVEAASDGIPLVVTDLPVSREVLSVNNTMSQPISFVAPGDHEAFSAEINNLNTPEFSRSYHSELTEKFSIAMHTKNLIELSRRNRNN